MPARFKSHKFIYVDNKAPSQGLIKMIEKALDYVFPSSFHVVKPLVLGEVCAVVARLLLR